MKKHLIFHLKYAVLFLIFSTPFLTNAQTSLIGKVLTAQGDAASFANVLLLNPIDSSLIRGGVTTVEGDFILKKIDKTDILLSISTLGYEPFLKKIKLRPNEINDVAIITLNENVATLEGVEIVAKKPLYTQEIDRTVINVQSSVTSTGGNALEILSKSPGVQVDQANNQLQIMGKQGVTVMINGKRSRMDLQALMQMLASLPANNIQKIEIITTPPANFDAEGNGGIINIVLIKNLEDGFNGNVGSHFAYGLRPKMGVNTNFNFRKGKLNLYGDFSYNHELVQATTTFGNTIEFNNENTQTIGISDRPALQVFHNARLGMDYEITDKTTFGVLFSGYSTLWKLDAQTDITTLRSNQPAVFEELQSLEKNHWLHGMTNFSLTHQFTTDEKLTLNYDYLYYIDDNPTDYIQENFDESKNLMTTQNFQSRKRTPIHIQVATADYSKKINDKLSIETGLKGTLSNFVNDISVAYQNDDEWIFDEDYTNIFDLEERIAAAYFSSNYQINEKTNLKAGLRYEYFTVHLSTETDANLVNRQSGNWFPSLFISRKINEQNLVQAAYSRRIQRPDFGQLAPALFFFGPNTLLSGNPSIQQSFTDNIKLDYRYKAYSFSVQYTYDDAPIAFGQPLVLAEKNQIVLQAANMDSRKMLSGTLSLPFDVTNWWTSRINLNGYWINQKIVVDAQVIDRKNWTYGFYTSQEFKLPKGYNLEINSNFYSAFQYGLSDVPIRWRLNAGLQKSFGDFKIAFNWSDILDTGSFWESRITMPELNRVAHFRYKEEGSIMRLSVSYQFGKKDLKSNRNRQTGSEEERRRVN